jgi:hypothetical protein
MEPPVPLITLPAKSTVYQLHQIFRLLHHGRLDNSVGSMELASAFTADGTGGSGEEVAGFRKFAVVGSSSSMSKRSHSRASSSGGGCFEDVEWDINVKGLLKELLSNGWCSDSNPHVKSVICLICDSYGSFS